MAAKFRSFLTVLGIIIGIASVIIVMAIGASAQRLVVNQVSAVGSNLIGVLPGASMKKGPPASALGIVTTTLKNSDLAALLQKKNVPSAINGTGYVSGVGVAKYQNNSIEATFQGVSSSYLDVENSKLGSGRFFTNDEDLGLARVAVLGANQAQNLFSNQDPVGKVLTLKDVNLIVVGVLEKRGATALSNSDDTIFIPLNTAQKLLLGINYLNSIRIKVDNTDNLDRAVADIETTLRIQHRIKTPTDDDFSVRNAAEAVAILTSITDVLKYFLAGIAAISLLVGGIGIMNIMLISVNQRIREVGLRKAVGARNRHIITQFLIESVFLTLIGGLVGIVFGVLFSLLASVVINALGYSWEFIISFSSILVATSVSVVIGMLFGIYPARKASRISPMEALRYE